MTKGLPVADFLTAAIRNSYFFHFPKEDGRPRAPIFEMSVCENSLLRSRSMRVPTRKTLLMLAAIAVLSLACVPAALADSVSFSLTSNNLGLGGSVGTVMITDSGTNQVTVTITMNAGFSLKLDGGDVAFNGPSGLTSGSASSVAGTAGLIGFAGLSFKQFHTNHEMGGLGKFSFDYANISGAPNGTVSADTLTFVLTAPGLMADQFTGAAIHFCTASGGDCGPKTGFASNGPPAAVPEPGTLSMIGTGLLGLGALTRKFIQK